MIEENLLQLQVGKTNGIYNKIYNCRPVMPSYEKQEGLLGTNKGLYSSEFFLDKRLGMIPYIDNEYIYTDDIVIDGLKYYLYHNDTEWYVGVEDGLIIKEICGPFEYGLNNPLRFATGRSAKGELKEYNLNLTNPQLGDPYVELDVGSGLNINPGDYVLFESNIFESGTVEVLEYDSGIVSVFGINDRGSLPVGGDKVSIYSKSGTVPIIGTNDGIRVIHIDGKNVCNSSTPLGGRIDDVSSYDEAIFALTEERVYYSRITNDDSVQIYNAPRGDYKFIEGGYKLISKGKFLIALGYNNRLIRAANNVNTLQDNLYVFSALNYNSDLYSKYSYLFTDDSLYFLQKDKQLMQIDISSLNNTAFELKSNNITKSVRGLVEDIKDISELEDTDYTRINNIMICNDTKNKRFLHFMYQDEYGNTIDYEYDKEYEHWLVNTYEYRINKISDQYLCYNHVSNIGGYKDLDKEYKQSINFILFKKGHSIMPIFVRTIFGLHREGKLELDIDVSLESNHSITSKKMKVKDNTFDLLHSDFGLTIDELFDNNNINKHNGSIASIQKPVFRKGRYVSFDYNGYNRFIYGYSYIPVKITNMFVNEGRDIS